MGIEHVSNPAAGSAAGAQTAAAVSNCCNSCHNSILDVQSPAEVAQMLERALPQLRAAAQRQS